MRVLVTGATGFIGSHVVRALVNRGDDVHVVTGGASSRRRLSDIEETVIWHPFERRDTRSIGPIVQAIRPDAAVDLAWYAEPGRYLNDVDGNLHSLQRTTQLLQGLLRGGCRRVVLAGTCLEQGPPSSIYAASKRAAHTVAQQLGADGLTATCAHVFYLYGPGEDPRRIVPTVIRALLRGEAVSVGDGSQVRDYLHVTDVAAAFCELLDEDVGPSIDICTGEKVMLREVLETIGRLVGESEFILFGEHDPSSDGYPTTGDSTLLRSIGWRPTIGLEAGLRDAISYWEAELGSSPESSLPKQR